MQGCRPRRSLPSGNGFAASAIRCSGSVLIVIEVSVIATSRAACRRVERNGDVPIAVTSRAAPAEKIIVTVSGNTEGAADSGLA